MKKILTTFLGFLLISCLTEPKNIEGDSENKNNYNISKEVLNSSNKTDYKDTEVIKDDLLENKKSNNDNLCIENLINLLSESADAFETFAFKNDYNFHKVETYDSFKVIYYKKADSFISFAVDLVRNQSMEMIHLETNSKNLYLDMKDEAVKLGFNYTDTKTFDKRVSEKERIYGEYIKGKYSISFMTNDAPNKLAYSIGLNKIIE